ncbi:TAP-like protein-domain-containing protein [Zopfochytrium polystomum]|nr:TAP-like protein-domain-containing protein [Zopfochytrium polystomum]
MPAPRKANRPFALLLLLLLPAASLLTLTALVAPFQLVSQQTQVQSDDYASSGIATRRLLPIPSRQPPQPSADPADPFGWAPVSLDYTAAGNNRSDLRTISIAVANSGVRMVKYAGAGLSAITGGQHDIFSFDPRGVGASHPVICFPSAAAHKAAEAAYFSFGTPHFHDSALTPASFDALAKGQAATCESHSGEYLRYISTAATARDMDAIRAALGQDKLDYWGISYGTFLGATYVNMFPDRVGRVVLDGVVDPTAFSSTNEALVRSALVDTESVLDGFASACERAAASSPDGCRLASLVTPARPTVLSVLRGGLTDLDAAPIATGTAPITLALFGVLYQPEGPVGWAAAADALYTLLDPARRDPVPLGKFFGIPDGTDPSAFCPAEDVTGQNAFYAVKCADGAPWNGITMEDVEALASELETELSPLIGRLLAYSDRICAHWPRPVERYAGPWNATLSNKVVLIGNTNDPITPLASARATEALMSGNAVLVTQRSYGHASIAQFSSCTVQMLQRYFIDGTVPASGTVCDADVPVFASTEDADSSVEAAAMRRGAEEVARFVAKANGRGGFAPFGFYV